LFVYQASNKPLICKRYLLKQALKPCTPQTNGLIERFNGRIGAGVLAITIYSHHQLAELLTAKPALAQDKPSGRAGPCDITKARLIADREGGLTTGQLVSPGLFSY